MVLASAIGAFFFAGMIEWPVLMRTRTSGNPLAELSRINRDTLYRSGRTGFGAMLAAWLILAF
jgi:hypothetical protein